MLPKDQKSYMGNMLSCWLSLYVASKNYILDRVEANWRSSRIQYLRVRINATFMRTTESNSSSENSDWAWTCKINMGEANQIENYPGQFKNNKLNNLQ